MNAPESIVHDPKAWMAVLSKESRPFSQAIILCDTNTEIHCLPYFEEQYLSGLELNHRCVRVNPGEESKSLASAERLWNVLIKEEVDRDALFIALGGGMITDLGGYVAASYKRGIRLINVPTTHLAMTDAALGGKNGVNHIGLKNQIGSIYTPTAVLIDHRFLESLPEKELVSGWIETVKHALIAEPGLWNHILKTRPSEAMRDPELLYTSARIKTQIATSDTSDLGIRQSLNFGHTVGHALEAQHELLHGEAVAFGIIAELYIARQHLGLPEEQLNNVLEYLHLYHGQLNGIKIDAEDLMASMRNDKKNRGGRIRFSLISQIGQAEVGVTVPDAMIKEAIDFAMQQVKT